MKPLSSTEIGERLKRIRLTSFQSQTDFAKQIGLKQNTYSAYENGTRQCSVEAAILVCRAHVATLDYIFLGDVDGLTVVRADELREVMP